MSLATAVQLRWPRIALDEGSLDIRFSRDFGDGTVDVYDQTNRITLTDIYPALISEGDFARKLQTSEGRTALDNIELVFNDITRYAGIDGTGASVAEQFGGPPAFSTVLEQFFNLDGEEDLPYWVWLTYHDTVGGQDIFFCGQYRARSKPQQFGPVALAQTAYEQRRGTRKVLCVAISSLLSEHTFEEVTELPIAQFVSGAGFPSATVDLPTVTDPGGSNHAKIWRGQTYQGWTQICTNDIRGVADAQCPGGVFTNYQYYPSITRACVHQHLYNGTFIEASKGDDGLGFYPRGLFWIKVTDFIGAILTPLRIQWDPDDIASAFNFHRQRPNESLKCMTVEPSAIDLDNLWVSVNAFFGYHPFDGFDGAGRSSTTTTGGAIGAFTLVVDDGIAEGQIAKVVDGSGNFYHYRVAASTYTGDPTISGPFTITLAHALTATIGSGSEIVYGNAWDQPAKYKYDEGLNDVLRGVCDFLQVKPDIIVDQANGRPRLVVTANGASGDPMPTEWIPGHDISEVERSTKATTIQVNNRADSLVINAPAHSSPGSTITREIPFRLRQWARTSPDASGAASKYLQTRDETWEDSKKLEEQYDECFKVVWFDSAGVAQTNPNVWKGLTTVCYRNINIVDTDPGGSITIYPTGYTQYPSLWQPELRVNLSRDWNDSFFGLGALYRAGDPSVMQEPNTDRFNSRIYPAVGLATMLLQAGPQLLRGYLGVANSAGKISAIKTGMVSTWRYGRNSAATFVAIEITSSLRKRRTTVTWQGGLNAAFPQITDVSTRPEGTSGGTTTTGTSSTSTGGGGGSLSTNALLQNPGTSTVNTVTPLRDGVVHLTLQGLVSQSSDFLDIKSSAGAIIFKVDAAGHLTAAGAQFTQNVDMSSTAIENLAMPTNDTDAANKLYVDGVIETVGAFSASQNDLALSTAKNVFRISATGAINITGIVPTGHGGKITLINVAANVISFLNSNAGSSAPNRFLFSGNKVLGLNGVITLWYDVISSRWRDISIGG